MLDTIKVILGLRVNRAEHGIGVSVSINMGDAPIIANDGDAFCGLVPTRVFDAACFGGVKQRR